MCPYLLRLKQRANIQFAGVNLKVIVGHPEHDLLFIAKQVADAAGLKDASATISYFVKKHVDKPIQLVWVLSCIQRVSKLVDSKGRKLQDSMMLLSEPQVYKLLMRGTAPQSEPFRKWVTEEVLPAIRKTGKYDINESDTAEEAVQPINC